MVADNESGESVESEVRTSSGMFLSKRQVSFDAIIFHLGTIQNIWESIANSLF